MKTVLFHREFLRFQGGHLKVWQYFNHVRSSPDHRAVVRFTAGLGLGRHESVATRSVRRCCRGTSPWTPTSCSWRAGIGAGWSPENRAESPVPGRSTCSSTCCTHRRRTRSGGGASCPTRRSGSARARRAQRRSTGPGSCAARCSRSRTPSTSTRSGRCPRPPARDIDLLVLATKQAPLGRAPGAAPGAAGPGAST